MIIQNIQLKNNSYMSTIGRLAEPAIPAAHNRLQFRSFENDL